MSILLIDLGNSRLKWALLTDAQWQAQQPLAYTEENICQLLDTNWASLVAPQQIVLSSVSRPAVETQLFDWITQHWQRDTQKLISPAQGCGVHNAYAEPGELGSDRWAAMVAAYQQTQTACCVISCGTALTIDAIDAQGQHLGGLIVPGLTTMQHSLSATTSLAQQALQAQNDIWQLGRSTQQCIQKGLLAAPLALLETVVSILARDHNTAFTIFLTGGDAQLLEPVLTSPCIYAPDLVLQGLALIAGADNQAR